jgi:hypothetical protein
VRSYSTSRKIRHSAKACSTRVCVLTCLKEREDIESDTVTIQMGGRGGGANNYISACSR